jgi:DNA-binding NtrC family response regulator
VKKPTAAPGPVLVVDDDRNHLRVLTGLLRLEGLECLAADGVDAALPIIERQQLALVITDLVMPGRSGLDLLAPSRGRRPAVPVILVSGHADIGSAVAAMKSGAYDFITKPVDEDELLNVVRKALAESRKDGELISAYFEPGRDGFPEVVGSSPALAKVLETVARIGPTDATVFISGETGVGKEMIVKALHATIPHRIGKASPSTLIVKTSGKPS